MWIFLTLATVRQAVARGNRGLQFLNLMMMKRMVDDDEDGDNKVLVTRRMVMMMMMNQAYLRW